MKIQILLLAIVGGLLAAPTARSTDSANTATAFAVNTPNRIEGSIAFYSSGNGPLRTYLYLFTLDQDQRVSRLAVNGQVVVGPNDEPLREFPFPLAGTVESLSISVQAHDDELDWNGNVVSSKDAGTGGAFYPEIQKGWRLYVSLVPGGMEVFVPFDVPPGSSMPEWSISYQGRSAGLTTLNGQTGFRVVFDVTYGYYWYSITRNGVETESGELDPFDILSDLPQGEQMLVRPVNGVEILDLRRRPWQILACDIDGTVASKHPDGWESQGVAGDAVAVRTQEFSSIQLRYAGPAAWLHIVEIDSQGQPFKDVYGNLHEWIVATNGPEWNGQSSLTTETLWLQTGRAVVTVTPADQDAPYRPYKMLGILRGGGKG